MNNNVKFKVYLKVKTLKQYNYLPLKLNLNYNFHFIP